MDVMKAKASKKEAEERPLDVFKEQEWKEWATVKVKGSVTEYGRRIIGDLLYLSYRGMYNNV